MKKDCGCKHRLPKPKKCCVNGVELNYIEIPASMGTSAPGQPFAPENGAHHNAIVKYIADGKVFIYTTEGIPVELPSSGGGGGDVISVNGKTGEVVLTTSDLENDSDYQSGTQVLNAINTAIGELSIPSKTSQLVNDGATGTSTYVEATALADEISARENADNGLQGQIDALAASSDVTDIVGTYADLQAYDTTKLKDNDIIKVLQDEQHDDETTYYRWSTTTETFTLIGEEGPYYTKSAADQKFQDKLTAGTNISIDPLTKTISASFDAETIFYANLNETGTSRHIYKDIAFTTAVSAQDLIDANDVGQVILRGTSTANPTAYSDSYLQNAFIMPHNNDFEFVFLDRDLRYEYTAGATTDTVFYYSTSEIQPKLTAGTNVTITGTTISATDTTYSDFTGTDGQAAGTAGLVPAPTTSDVDKYLKGDGTWGIVDAEKTVSESDYDPVTNRLILWNLEAGVYKIVSNNSANYLAGTIHNGAGGDRNLRVGGLIVVNEIGGASATPLHKWILYPEWAASYGIASAVVDASGTLEGYSNGLLLGTLDVVNNLTSTSSLKPLSANQGRLLDTNKQDTLTAGSNISIDANNEISATDTTYSDFTGTDGQTAGAAGLVPAPATTDDGKFLSAGGAWGTPTDTTYTAGAGLVLTGTVFSGDVNYRALNGASAPTTATEAKYVGQLYYDTTGGDMYYCSAITPQGTIPETYTYTWVQLGGGGGGFSPYDESRNYSDIVIPDGPNYTPNNTSVYISPRVSGTLTPQSRTVNILGKANNIYTQSVQIGYGAEVTGTNAIAIGESNAAARALAIGSDYTGAVGADSIAIGQRATTNGNANYGISMGYRSSVTNVASLALGYYASASGGNSVALGRESKAERNGEVNIGAGTTTNGYNSTSYRVLGGVHDAVDTHDATTLGQLNARIVGSGTAAPTTSTAGSVGSLYAYVESGTGHLAICTDDTGGTYTWQTLV